MRLLFHNARENTREWLKDEKWKMENFEILYLMYTLKFGIISNVWKLNFHENAGNFMAAFRSDNMYSEEDAV